jgi:uncharacterized integral membrane protein
MSTERKPVNWRAWIAAILAVLILIVAIQNAQQVRVDVLFLTVDAPLIVILLAAVTIGGFIGYVTPVLRQHRRDRAALSKPS